MRRVSLRDRAWVTTRLIRVVGPFDGLGAGRLRSVLRAWHAADPGGPLTARLARRGTRWTPAPAGQVDALVADLGASVTGDRVAEWLVDEPLGDRSAVFAAGGGYVGVNVNHAVGDGRVVNAYLVELLRAAAESRAPRPPFRHPTRAPLARALVRQFARAPARWPTVVRVARPPRSAGPAVPWRAAVAYRAGWLSPEAYGALRRWRDARARGVSAAAVVFAATWAAFAHCGLRPTWPGAVFLIDGRRYLPPGAVVPGNLVWGQYLVPADPADPRAVHEALRAELASGRMLVMLALRWASVLLRGTGAAVPESAGGPAPELTFSHFGRTAGMAELPWRGGPAEPESLTILDPAGPGAIALAYEEIGGGLHLTAAFHRTSFDPVAVGRALDRVALEPVPW